MNREIKFRAWVKAEKLLGQVKTISIHSGAFVEGAKPGDNTEYEGFTILAPQDGRFCALNQIELMQYTGLKDRNGVEIYEGDVLQRTQPTQGSAKTFTVNWRADGSQCGFNLKGARDGRFSSLEVIGNVYEQPAVQEAHS